MLYFSHLGGLEGEPGDRRPSWDDGIAFAVRCEARRGHADTQRDDGVPWGPRTRHHKHSCGHRKRKRKTDSEIEKRSQGITNREKKAVFPFRNAAMGVLSAATKGQIHVMEKRLLIFLRGRFDTR